MTNPSPSIATPLYVRAIELITIVSDMEFIDRHIPEYID